MARGDRTGIGPDMAKGALTLSAHRKLTPGRHSGERRRR